ncbi:MAG: glycosyltransferase [Planctomycetes bacterium]|nr:glycosyltransferase [Planctomycetota bacterium]
MDALDRLRVVLVHDWLTGMRGGEKVLEVLCRRWPSANLYTLLYRRGSTSPAIENLDLHASFLHWLPGVHRYYRYLLPIMPWAVGWQLPECDLVVSSSHCVAKGVTPPPGVPHICYCYTPMRYAWHLRESYFRSRGLKSWLIDRLMSELRSWDRRTASGVTHFVTSSETVRNRIRECYGRDSAVIYPPVDTEYYTPAPPHPQPFSSRRQGVLAQREDHYLVLSAFAPYKRIDLAIEACKLMGRRLVLIGSGQDERKLRALGGPMIHFLGWQSNDVLRDHLRRCRALLFPGEEDFGIVPVEANACGTPVIAYGRGGATETIVPLQHPAGLGLAPTGVWFEEQTPACLASALEQFERNDDAFDAAALRRHALQFSASRFEREIFAFVRGVMGARRMLPLAA